MGLISSAHEKALDDMEQKYLWDVLTAFFLNENFMNIIIRVLEKNVEHILKMNADLAVGQSGCETGLSCVWNVKHCNRAFLALLKTNFYRCGHP